jgi:hypothetical protein
MFWRLGAAMPIQKLIYRIPGIVWFFISIAFFSITFSFRSTIVFYALTLSAILIHEAGHAIAAKLVGLPIIKFQVGQFQVDFSTGRRKLHCRRMMLGLGVVTVDPSNKPPDDAIVAMRRMTIAGPLASFVCAIPAWLWSFSPPDQSLYLGLTWFACINSALAMSAIFPGDQMDGTQFRRLKVGSRKVRNLIQGYWLAVSMGRPVRPRELPAELLEIAVALLNEPETQLFPETKINATRFLYMYLADWGHLAEAQAWLEWATSTVAWSKPMTNREPMDVLFALRALHYGLWNKDPGQAAATISLLHKRSWVLRSAEVMMPRALFQLSRGDRKGARRLVSTVRFGLQHSFETPGYAQMLNEWLDIIEQRINDASAPAPSIVATPAD